MPADLATNTTAGAFVAGLVTSLHCAGMCGPLLCAALPKPTPSYHAGRLVSYSALGAICGAIGSVPLQKMLKTPLAVLPWVLVALMLLIAFGLKPRLPRPMFLRKWYARRLLARQASTPAGPHWKGFGLGLVTPLLPCGPLYLMLGATLLAGSALQGLQFAAAFVLGTIPMLWVAQGSFGLLGRRLSPQRMSQIQRGLALFAAGILIWRLTGSLMAPEDAAPKCPLCHGHE